jgi:hypothetical protein
MRVEASLVLVGIRVAEISDRHIEDVVLDKADPLVLNKYPRPTV